MSNVRCRCGKLLSYKPEMAGRKARCPHCSAMLNIPTSTLALQDEVSPSPLPSKPSPSAPPKADPFEGQGIPLAEDPVVAQRPAVPLAYAPTVKKRAELRPEPAPVDESFNGFIRAAWQAVLFPLRGNALVSVLCGVVFFYLAGIAIGLISAFPFVGGIIALFLSLCLAGYAMGYLMNLVRDSAHGEEDAPDWSDLKDWQENAAKPLLLFIGLLCLCLAAAGVFLLVQYARGEFVLSVIRPYFRTHPDRDNAILRALAVLGSLYLPAGMLCVSLANGVAGLNPICGIRAIAARPARYLVLVLLLAAVEAIEWPLRAGIRQLGIPIVGTLAASFVRFYSLLLLGRLMGVFYRTGGEKLREAAGG